MAFQKQHIFLFGVTWLVFYVALWLHRAICVPTYAIPVTQYNCGGYSHFLADHDYLYTFFINIEGVWLVLLTFGITVTLFVCTVSIVRLYRKGSKANQ